MKTRYYIKNTRVHLPLLSTAVAYLLLDKFNASDLIWGIVGTVYFIIWIAAIIIVWKSEGIDIFEDHKPDLSKKSFAEKLKEMADERKKSL